MRLASLLVALAMGCSAVGAAAQPVIVHAPDASPAEVLAAREVWRYVYLRTGRVLAIEARAQAPAGEAIVVARGDRALATGIDADAKTLVAQEYLLRSGGSPPKLLVSGGDDPAILYAAYRFAESLGVRFYLHGDVVPEEKIELAIPQINERRKPLFDRRGIQPFHDFPEGPDWWNADDYKAILAQLPKMGMNFFGLHTYPEGGVGPEPAVWIGRPEDIGDGRRVAFAYPSSWMNTLRGNWGYAARNTGDYIYGARELFEHDAYGGSVMIGHCPRPKTPEASVEVFERAGALLDDAFGFARRMGIKTCIGTETPLIVPKIVRDRSPGTTAEQYYEGMFRRIARTHPLDYYWFWTPEGWTWDGVKDEQVAATVADLNAAITAAKKAQAPFTLATCGWVLGPPKNRALFDTILPKDMPMSCINRQVGKDFVEPGFAKVQGRPKWAIPWMEDDPNLAYPQLWAGRMRKDAADALAYGCTGLMGIHWRTRILAPNVSALAQAAWDQSGWNVPQPKPEKAEGAIKGQHAAFPNATIADAADQVPYRTVRYDVDAYHLKVPPGTYRITLMFCEPAYGENGRRIFGVSLQGKTVIEALDIHAKVGKNKALDYRFDDVKDAQGWIDIEFSRIVEFPSIAGIVIEGKDFQRRINCGGPAHGAFSADVPPSGPSAASRFLPCGDFYRDFAEANFGKEAAAEIGAIFEKIDGHFPEPSTWINGPGGIAPGEGPWKNAGTLYAFVDELSALRPRLRGAGNLERFDYWLANFRYMRSTEKVKALWSQYNEAMKRVAAEKDAAAKAKLAESAALPLRKELVKAVGEVYVDLLATVNTPGELGTVANWEQHILPGLLIQPGKDLAAALGRALPADAHPVATYQGKPRLIVPTVRTSIDAGEALRLGAIVLSAGEPGDVVLRWRTIGAADFAAIPLQRIARGVFEATIPSSPAGVAGIEYYVQCGELRFPAAAPNQCQTVVVIPGGR